MTTLTLYHGGIAGKSIGDELVPSPPHIHDGCPICVARAAGRTVTAAEYRDFLKQFGDRAKPILETIADAPDDMPIDPPSAKSAVYVTSDINYARWYAARSSGDLYRVEAIGDMEPSTEDPFPSWTAPTARVVEVLERRVQLKRRDRRELFRAWGRADRRMGRMAA